jgi:UDP-2,3-diacylglucosamine pyrophosphatase LpxH
VDNVDSVVYVVSDLHLGPGKLPNGQWDPLEDFKHDAEFITFLETIGRSAAPVELVLAGDFLEYPQVLPKLGLTSPGDQFGTTEAESLLRTEVILGLRPEIAGGHREVFQALRRFMMEGHSITIVVGNHDVDLLWRRVWALVFDTIYPPGAWGDLRRVPYSYTLGNGNRGRVYIEHGHEYDPPNRITPRMEHPFLVDDSGVQRLVRCWGTLFVDKVYNQLERDRWFIDNVKPILRVVKLGLRNDFRFTATALGLVTRFLVSSGLPPLGAGSDMILGAGEPPTLEEMVASVADPDLRAALEAQLADPAARADLERELLALEPVEWAMIQSGMTHQQTLDEAIEGPQDDLILGFGAQEDGYRAGARTALEADPSLSTVIMGHTHGPIDGATAPLDLSDGRKGFYYNSGTWTPHLKDEGRRSYSWNEIGDPASYTASLSYVRLDPDGRGGYAPTLHSFQAER